MDGSTLKEMIAGMGYGLLCRLVGCACVRLPVFLCREMGLGQSLRNKASGLMAVLRGKVAITLQDLFRRQHPNDRVLLVGETRRHESVEAGRIFAQLQDAGMKTFKLDQIVRQRDPELKQTVEQLARGEVGEAIVGLQQQGRIHEVKGHTERIAAIAKEYAQSPESTLVVSPDNRSRAEINVRIHAEMQAKGVVGQQEHPVPVSSHRPHTADALLYRPSGRGQDAIAGSWSHASIGQLLRCARGRRKAFNRVAGSLRTLAHNSQRRGLAGTRDAIQSDDLLAR